MTFTEAALACGFESRSEDVVGNVSSRYSRTVRRLLGVPPRRLLRLRRDRRRELDLKALRQAASRKRAAGAGGG